MGIFSLTTELPFAGHPTLGTARAWLDAGGVPRTPGRAVQECGMGLVPVRIDDDTLVFAAPPLIRSGPADDADLAVALSVLGVTLADVVEARWIDNGPGWLGVLLPSADAAIEVGAFFHDGGGPLREDPVTGSLNASVARWLTGSGRVKAPYVARQGERLGRDGRVSVTESDGELWIAGSAVVTVRGTVEV